MKLAKNLSNITRQCLILLTALASVSLSSCKDDDDDKKLSDDPRVRKVLLSEFPDYEFIVNDVEGIIFNYDSLPYGSKVDSLIPYIYGYASTDLLIGIKKDGTDVLSLYMNNTPLDLSKPLSLVTTSEDTRYNKVYTFDLRVHKYDVDAFDWDEVANLELEGDTILSEKSIVYNGVYSWFVRTDSGSFVFRSNDGKAWTKSNVSSSSEIDFSNLALCGDTLFAISNDGIVLKSAVDEISFTEASFESYSNVDKILFVLDNKLWFVSGDNVCAYSKGKVVISNKMSESFSKAVNSGEFKTFAASSGYTTLGYVYSSVGKSAEVWSIDRYGNVVCLSRESLPVLTSPIVFNYGETLGLIGGYDSDKSLSSKCFSSDNSGLTWTSDWHKDFSASVGAMASAGVFVTSEKGELLLVGGVNKDGVSKKVFAGRLRKLKQHEDFLNSIK